MPHYGFQVRTDGVKISRNAELKFDNLEQAIFVARRTIKGRAVYDASMMRPLAESFLEIVDDHGDLIASLPIGAPISRH